MGFSNSLKQYLNRRLFGNSVYFSQVVGQKGPVWISTDEPFELYNTIPQLKAVIDRKASMFCNMEIYLVDAKGNRKEDKDLQKLIQNPNPIQTMNGFLKEFKIQEQVYGNQFMFKNKPSNLYKYPATLFNISSNYIQPILSGKIFRQVSVDDIIKGYEYKDASGTKENYDTNDILYSRLTNINHPVLGLSPVTSLQYVLSNIKLAYEFRNVTMAQRGPLGILSNESKDSMGAIPLTSDERKKVEEQFTTEYGIGIGQRKIKLTEASLKWQAMSFATKDMMLFEEVDSNLITLVDSFGLNINMFSNKNATFENVKNSILQVYQDTIIPEADQFTQSFGKFIGVPENLRLVASYEHLSLLKENKQKGLQGINTLIDALTKAVSGGLLDAAMATQILAKELQLA
jgi:phage portal protein BeeE